MAEVPVESGKKRSGRWAVGRERNVDPVVLREVYQHAPLPWTLVDLQGRMVAVNPAACEFLGYAEHELVGQLTPVAARPDAPRHQTTRALVTHLLDGTIDRYEDEKRFVHKNGNEVWAKLTVTVVRDDDGAPQHVMTLWQDITSRKQVEDALQVAEERFLAAFEHSPIGMAITDLAGVVLQANRAMAAIAPANVGARCELLHCEPADLRQLVGRAVPFVRHERPYADERSPGRWAEVTAALVCRSDGVPLYLVWHVEDVTDRRQRVDELAWRATHDNLTGLPNRAVLLDRLGRALERRDGSVAVLFLDLDGLKAVNDRLGHETGDRLLVAVADRLRETLRPADTVARLGGDELVIVCEDLDVAGGSVIADRVLDAVTSAGLEAVGAPVTASIGLAVGATGASPDGLLHKADEAMYRAKAAGGGRVAGAGASRSPS
ncbi:MAG: hypothetical protein QOE35_3210 [Actinomycetota bacterium]